MPTPTLPAATPDSRRAFWITLVGSWVLRLLALTLRIEVEAADRLRTRLPKEPFIFVSGTTACCSSRWRGIVFWDGAVRAAWR